MRINLFFILQNGKKTTTQSSLFEVALLFFPFCSTLPSEFLKQASDEHSSSLAFSIFKTDFPEYTKRKSSNKNVSLPKAVLIFFYVYVFFNCDRRKFLCTTEKKEIILAGFSPRFRSPHVFYKTADLI